MLDRSCCISGRGKTGRGQTTTVTTTDNADTSSQNRVLVEVVPPNVDLIEQRLAHVESTQVLLLNRLDEDRDQFASLEKRLADYHVEPTQVLLLNRLDEDRNQLASLEKRLTDNVNQLAGIESSVSSLSTIAPAENEAVSQGEKKITSQLEEVNAVLAKLSNKIDDVERRQQEVYALVQQSDGDKFLNTNKLLFTNEGHVPEKSQRASETPQLSSEDTGSVETAITVKSHDDAFVKASVDQWLSKKLGEEYEFSKSIWDLALFVGGKHLGLYGGTWVVLLLFCNILLQSCLCLIIHDTFTIPVVDDDLVAELELWRFSIAHDFKWMDELTHRSLAKRVCDGDRIPPMSSSVSDLLDMIDSYQTDSGVRGDTPVLGFRAFFWTKNIGICMAYMAVIVWWLEVNREFAAVIDFVVATSTIPVTSVTEILMRDHGALKLKSISPHRRFYFIAIAMVRLLLAVLLLFTGTCYLMFTINLRDVLLNSAALSIVLSIDEAMFDSLSPLRGKALIRDMKPLHRPREHVIRVRGLDHRPVVLMAVCLLGLTCVFYGFLMPQNEKLQKARSVICDGNTKFVSTIDPYGAVLATTTRAEATGNAVRNTYRYMAVEELVHTQGAALERMSTPTEELSRSAAALAVYGASYSVDVQASLSVGRNLDYWVTDCSDMPSLSECNHSFLACWRVLVLQDLAKDSSISGCEEVVKFCGTDDLLGVRSRQYCPRTCGCHDVSFSNMFFSSDQGCAPSCRNIEYYKNKMQARSCSDVSKDSPEFKEYVEGVKIAMASYTGSGWYGIADPVKARIEAVGCSSDILSVDGGGYDINLCEDFNILNWKPMNYLCPVACDCKNNARVLCPLTCSR